MGEMVGGLSAVFTLFCIALAILWILVPFAIFGIKPRLDRMIANQAKMIEQQEMTNRWLAASYKEQMGITASLPPIK